MKTEEWHLAFDGSSTHRGGGAEVVSYAPVDADVFLTFKMEFLYTNNEAKYEALITELIAD